MNPTMNKHKQGGKMSRGAFTLVEVMIASSLSAILLMGVYAGVIMGMRANYINAQEFAAFGVAKEQLEQFRGSSQDNYDTITSSTNWEYTALTHLGGTQRKSLMCMFSNNVVDSSSGPTLKTIRVTVVWTNMGRGLTNVLNGWIYRR